MGALCSSTTNAAVAGAVAPESVPKVDVSGSDLVQLSTNLITLKQDVEDLTKQTQVALLQDATEKVKEAVAAVTAAAVLSPTGTTSVPVTVVTDCSGVTVPVPVLDASGTLLNLLASNVARDIQQYKEATGIATKE
jgi:lipoprotein-anchoring transpeptidase ErfK/SrfK